MSQYICQSNHGHSTYFYNSTGSILDEIFISFPQFLKFMNHKKSRLTDLFRKMDKNNDGLIPREDFIDGIIKTSMFSQQYNALILLFVHIFGSCL